MQKSSREAQVGERGEVTEVKAYRYRVRSFMSSKTYVVDLAARYCGCPHHSMRGAVCKHLILAEAVEAARGLRFGKYAAEESVTRLCKAIFSETNFRDTYRLLGEVMASPYATEAMRRAARTRHAKALSRTGRAA